MRQCDFAKLIGVSQATICQWGKNGWLAYTDGVLDPEASKARILAERGTLRRYTQTEISRMSPWRRGPHCRTKPAWKSWREKHGGAA
jgi:hypothetical protein